MSGKLSNNIIPINYNLLFEPSLKTFTFTGRAIVQIRIRKGTSSIVLNSKDLKIVRAFLQHKKELFHPKIHIYKEKELLILKFNKSLHPSAYNLTIEFEGQLTDELSGFYRSKYTQNKKIKYLATTQFEAPYARKAFPCFDQPDMKATFDLSLLIDRKLSAVSNMPVKYEEFQGNKKLISFDRTPMMSTYLLYMGIGEFEYLHDIYDNRVRLRIVTTKGKSKQGRFALELTKKFLKYFEDYSEVHYPLPKLDLIAIPDFAAGAMENWGAITFREIILLYDKNKTSLRVKKRIAEVIAHELWHQWSGNLVTMGWWDDLWLNESFATYMAFKAVAHYFPTWDMWQDFIESETNPALIADSLKTTHPILVHVSEPNEVEEIFDKISYGKGGSVLRMIDNFLGEENFRRGISNYLKEYKYQNAKAEDLWNSLQQTSDSPIKKVMESWINQPGYPLIEAHIKRGHLILNQRPFNKQSGFWLAPLDIESSGKEIRKLMLKKRMLISGFQEAWLKLNKFLIGFYRVKYGRESLEKLKPAIRSKKLSIIDRWNIQDDLFNLARMREISLDNYLGFLECYENEDSYLVLSEIYSNLYEIYLQFSSFPLWEKIWPQYSELMSKPFRKQFAKLGWSQKKNEKVSDTLLRSICISYLSFVKDRKTVQIGKKKFQNYKNLNPNISGSVYALVASNGSQDEYKKMLKMYETHPILEERLKLLSAIYRFKSEAILKQALTYSLTSKVRTQELGRVFSSASSNPLAKKIFLTWVKENWDKLKKYEKTHYVFKDLLEALITSYTDKKILSEIAHFLKANKIKYEKAKANAFETAYINASFIQRNIKVLENYFKHENGKKK